MGKRRNVIENTVEIENLMPKMNSIQISHACDDLIIQHTRNVTLYEKEIRRKNLEEVRKLTNEFKEKEKELCEMKKEMKKHHNDEIKNFMQSQSSEARSLRHRMNQCVISIRKTQDKMKEKMKELDMFHIHDDLCNEYTSKIAKLMSKCTSSMKKGVKRDAFVHLEMMRKEVEEFHRISNVKSREFTPSCQHMRCNVSPHHEIGEMSDGTIYCLVCAIKVGEKGLKTNFKNQKDLKRYMKRDENDFEEEMTCRNELDSKQNENTKKTIWRKVMRNRKRKRENESDSVQKKDSKCKKVVAKKTKKRRSATYKRLNHFREMIRQATGNQEKIPEEVKSSLMFLMKMQKIKPEQITPSICRDMQGCLKMNQNKGYDSCVSICMELNPNFKPMKLSEEQILTLQMRFVQLESVFDEACANVCPRRKNFPSYSQVFFRLCQDINIPDSETISSVNFLKNSKLMHNADVLHAEMCRLLGWFRRSPLTKSNLLRF